MWDHWATLLPDKDFPIVHGAGRGCRVCPAFPMMYQRMSGLVSHGEKKQLTGLSAIGNDPLLLLLLGRGGGSCVLEVSAACTWGYWFASQGMK